MRQLMLAILGLMLLVDSAAHGVVPNLAQLEQEALLAATDNVADSVVQIRTVGGLDRVGKTLLSQGPTTGLVVSEDGYIVSSAFNFAGQPTSILVRLANGTQLAAELIARDQNRMLVLLKVDSDSSLPVPEPVPLVEMQVGQWAVALGRTFQAEQVGMSVGIVSALQRMYGRVIQSDASVSVANYGGPLVDVSGRVLGVLVPMSPQAGGGEASELAGAEYYDSGIGFAVPLEHILETLERWKRGEDLLSGKLGIGMLRGDAHIVQPKITSVWPKSPAAEAGWKPDDLITAIDGLKVATQAQLRFQIVPRYAGDTVSVSLLRGEEELQTNVTLTGKLAPYRHAFLGILPTRAERSEESDGAIVRAVWKDGPAEKAGVEAGDVITKINDTPVKKTLDALGAIAKLHPEQSIALDVTRGDAEQTLTATLSTSPEQLLPSWTLNAGEIAGDTPPRGDVPELKQIKLPEFSRVAGYFAPNADQSFRPGLLIWLGDGVPENNQALVDAWQADCMRDGLVLLVAPPEEDSAWKADDLPYLSQLTRAATRRLGIDRRRLVIAGKGKSGQLAYALAFKKRSAFRGVVGIDAPLPRTLKLASTTPSRRLAVLSIESKNSNFAPLIRRDVKQLREAGYPTISLQRPVTNVVSAVIEETTRDSIARWVDSLDSY